MSFKTNVFALPLLVAAAVLAAPAPSSAQLFPDLFSRDNQRANPPVRDNRDSDEDPQRVERLENMVRQLTGQNEQLQFRVRQLEEQLRAQGGAAAAAAQAPVAQLPPPVQQPVQQQPSAPPIRQQQAVNQPPGQISQGQIPQGQPAPIQQPQGQSSGRRGDAFDPNVNPNAPGAPRALGGGQLPIPAVQGDQRIGAPGGRDPGEPLDLATTSPRGPNGGAQQAAPPQRAPGAQAGLTTLPPGQTPRDEFDLGIGYMQRKDYALAEETMRNFVQKYPSDRLTADAQYWLGESQFQRQQYNDAAESFLNVTSKHGTSAKAPDSLLRLGQSLAALKQKDAACAAFGEVGRKYPKASGGVKQGVEREQKRAGC